tara:strand:- start:159 stop:611 length:453 start_codon:yes stop_codon:yes gene_type:complete
MALVHNLHYVDDKVFGYRRGYFFWLALYIVNLVVLSVDDATGPQRDYVTYTSLMSCLTLVYYSYNQFIGNPGSVPGQHAAGAEGLARMILAAHYRWGDLVGSNPLGVWNVVLLALGGTFGLTKLGENLHSIYNRQVYLTYVDEQKEAGIV